MDSWRVAVLGDGGVGKTALAVQVSDRHATIVCGRADIITISLPSIVLLVRLNDLWRVKLC